MMTNRLFIVLLCVSCLNSFAATSEHGSEWLSGVLKYTPSYWVNCLINPKPICLNNDDESFDAVEIMLRKKSTQLRTPVIDKVLAALSCWEHHHVPLHNNRLTVIDYSLPSSEKRLWIFDLNSKELLFHTYVAHGIKSGQSISNSFSNKYDSKSSSIGVFKTDKPYYGRHGISLKLEGLERGFNDNAANRAIVMHGGWYVEEEFIKKYGRAGRSWGCPAVPDAEIKPIIEAIKEQSLFVVYYPSDEWFLKSKFLNCTSVNAKLNTTEFSGNALSDLFDKNAQSEPQEIVFIDVNNNLKREENEPIIAMSTAHYKGLFSQPIPLVRMLRRQINHEEYVALNQEELKHIYANADQLLSQDTSLVYFVIPEVMMQHGYYATEMKVVNLGRVTQFHFNEDTSNAEHLGRVEFAARQAIPIRATNRFIRWIGL